MARRGAVWNFVEALQLESVQYDTAPRQSTILPTRHL